MWRSFPCRAETVIVDPGRTPRDPFAGLMVRVGGGIELAVTAVQLAAANAASENTTGSAKALHRRTHLDSLCHTAERLSPESLPPRR